MSFLKPPVLQPVGKNEAQYVDDADFIRLSADSQSIRLMLEHIKNMQTSLSEAELGSELGSRVQDLEAGHVQEMLMMTKEREEEPGTRNAQEANKNADQRRYMAFLAEHRQKRLLSRNTRSADDADFIRLSADSQSIRLMLEHIKNMQTSLSEAELGSELGSRVQDLEAGHVQEMLMMTKEREEEPGTRNAQEANKNADQRRYMAFLAEHRQKRLSRSTSSTSFHSNGPLQNGVESPGPIMNETVEEITSSGFTNSPHTGSPAFGQERRATSPHEYKSFLRRHKDKRRLSKLMLNLSPLGVEETIEESPSETGNDLCDAQGPLLTFSPSDVLSNQSLEMGVSILEGLNAESGPVSISSEALSCQSARCDNFDDVNADMTEHHSSWEPCDAAAKEDDAEDVDQFPSYEYESEDDASDDHDADADVFCSRKRLILIQGLKVLHRWVIRTQANSIFLWRSSLPNILKHQPKVTQSGEIEVEDVLVKTKLWNFKTPVAAAAAASMWKGQDVREVQEPAHKTVHVQEALAAMAKIQEPKVVQNIDALPEILLSRWPDLDLDSYNGFMLMHQAKARSCDF